MKIVDIDYYAVSGNSLLHKTGTGLKLLWVIALIVLDLCLTDYKELAIVYLFIFLYVIFSKLPSKRILLLSMYPIIFSILFLVSINNSSVDLILLILLRVLIASTILILLFITTSYVKLFSFIGRYLPTYLVTGLMLTYRSIFILWQTLEDINQSLRLRGGLTIKNPKRSLQVLSNALGFLVIKSLESSEKIYDGMRLRGHAQRLRYLDNKSWTE